MKSLLVSFDLYQIGLEILLNNRTKKYDSEHPEKKRLDL